MDIKIEKTSIDDVVIVSHSTFEDDRGFFMEVFHKDIFAKAGLHINVVQQNHSRSTKNVLRGLHYQWDPPMGKLMRVTLGIAFFVAVDIRIGSPTLGKYFSVILKDSDRKQVWAPAGFARGFYVLSEYAEIQYSCTGTYNDDSESGIAWNDPAIGIKWPTENPILSNKDANAQTLDQWLEDPNSKNFKFKN